MAKGIRRYGFGKFSTILDSYVYALTLGGLGEGVIGDVDEIGYAAEGILLGPDSLPDIEWAAKEQGDKLTQEERDLVARSYGAIVIEDNQGFVAVDYYDNEKEFKEDLQELEDQASEGEGE
jgi:hypothetical protein